MTLFDTRLKIHQQIRWLKTMAPFVERHKSEYEAFLIKNDLPLGLTNRQLIIELRFKLTELH